MSEALHWFNHPCGMEAHNGQGIYFVCEEDGRYSAGIRPKDQKVLPDSARCGACGRVKEWLRLGNATTMEEAMALCEAEATHRVVPLEKAS